MSDSSRHGSIVEFESLDCVVSRARVSSRRMETVRTVTKRCRLVEVEIHKFDAFDTEVFSARRNNAMSICVVHFRATVVSLAESNSTNDLRIAINDVFREGELHARKNVICNLEVVELDCSNSFSNCAISAILPGHEIPEISNNRFVGRVGICWISAICERFAGEFARNQIMENSEAIPSIRMGHIVYKLANFGIFRANIQVERRSHRIFLRIVPVRVPVRASGVISAQDVIWVGDPEGGRRLISVQKRPRSARIHNQIVLNQLVSFSCIFNENCVAHIQIGDVVLDGQVVHAVNCHRTIVGVMNCVVSHVRFSHRANHVEVDGVATKLESLATVEEFSVLDAANRRLVPGRMNHNVRSVLILRRSFRISLEFQISSQKTNFCSHLNTFSASSVHGSVMLVNQRLVKRHQRFGRGVTNGGDGSLFGVPSAEVS